MTTTKTESKRNVSYNVKGFTALMVYITWFVVLGLLIKELLR